jgi:hypothetical protein
VKINGVWLRDILRDAEGGGGGGAGGAGAAAGGEAGGAGGGAGGEAGGAGAAAGGEAGGAGGTAAGGSWRDGLADDLRGHPALNHDSVGALAKDFVGLQEMIGKKGAILPGDDADEAAWAGFYGQVGRPEKVEDYQFQPTEGVTVEPALDKWFRETAHKHGLSERQAAGIYGAWNEQIAALSAEDAEAAAKREKYANETLDGLKSDWGDRYEENMALAQRGARAAFGESLDAALSLRTAEGVGLLDHPLFARAFSVIGRAFGEDGTLAGAGAGGGYNGGTMTPAQAKAEIAKYEAEIQANKDHPYHAGRGKEYMAAQKRMADLYAMAFPDEARA